MKDQEPTRGDEPPSKRLKATENAEVRRAADPKDDKKNSSSKNSIIGEQANEQQDADKREEKAQTVSQNSTKSETKRTADEINEHKMILFLTGKPASERSRYAKAFKFPTKLYYVLECGEYDDIVSWSLDGRSFRVAKPEIFASKVLPEVFREAKFSSFHRKLNRWNFVKVAGKQGTYSHPLFRRGELHLCKSITCSNSTSYSHAMLSEHIPNGMVSAPSLAAPYNHNVNDHDLTKHQQAIAASAGGVGRDLQHYPFTYVNPDPRLMENQNVLSSQQFLPIRTIDGSIPPIAAGSGTQGGLNLHTAARGIAGPSMPGTTYSRINELENELLEYRHMRRMRMMAAAAPNMGYPNDMNGRGTLYPGQVNQLYNPSMRHPNQYDPRGFQSNGEIITTGGFSLPPGYEQQQPLVVSQSNLPPSLGPIYQRNVQTQQQQLQLQGRNQSQQSVNGAAIQNVNFQPYSQSIDFQKHLEKKNQAQSSTNSIPKDTIPVVQNGH